MHSSHSMAHDANVDDAANAASFAIEGMSCASCVSRIEKAVRAVPGVASASVNLATNRADVQFGAPATAEAIAAAIRKAGYTPTVKADAGMDGHSGHMHHDESVAKLTRSLILAAMLTLPLVAMAMGPDLFPRFDTFIDDHIGVTPWRMIEWALATLVLFGPGLRFFTSGVPALLRGAPEMDALVALGTFAAWAYSSVATFAPQLFPAGTAQVYFESAGVIVTLILLGRLLEARAKGAAGDAIKHLLGLRPETAQVIRNGAPVEVKLAVIVPGDLVLIRPGERVPLDGVVTDGGSFVDQSMLTGEAEPVRKSIGDEVVGGTINTSGSLTVKVTKTGADTVLSRIIKMVEQAQGAKLPIQALVDRVTGWFVPAVIAIAAVTFVVWFFFVPQPALGFALVNMVAVLIIACPCAMGLATPVSIMVATGRAAELGILLRQGAALEALRDVGVIAFDKTGTLTKGHPELTDFSVAPGFAEADVLALAASVEANSEHPISRAIIAAAKAHGLALQKAEAFEAVAGFGVTAKVGAKKIAIGADRFMAKLGIAIDTFGVEAARLANEGKSPLFIAIDGKLAGILAVADPIKPSAQRAIAALKAQGLACAMVSGDKQATAEAIARQLGIDHVVAEVLPEGKVAAVESLRQGGKKLAFVGDGINDAPALAAADVGIAVGTGTDIAIESADVVLMSGELDPVVSAVALSRATLRNIGQNLFWAFGYNVVLIPVAAGVLYPAFQILLSPMLAAGAMAFSSVFVVMNALRLKRFKPAA